MAGLNVNDEHRPLRGGISIVRHGGGIGRGTLCLIARRQLDHKKVLTTAAHNFGDLRNSIKMCQGGDEYNDRVARRYSETLDDGSTRESYKYHESTPDSVAKFGDFAAALLLTDSNGERDSIEGLDGVFGVHKHEEGSNSNHQPLPVVKDAYDPVRNKAYDLYGAKSGITQVTVNDVDREYEVDTGRWMRGLILLDESRSSPRPTDGDSGAPIVVEDPDGNLRIVALYFGGIASESIGFAYPASVVEQELGIYFGVSAPTALATAPEHVAPGTPFVLNGESSDAQEDGATITKYQWVWLSGPPPAGTTVQPPPTGGFPFHYPEQTTPNLSISGHNLLGDYAYKLIVTDSNGAKASTTVIVAVAPNNPPTANAGDDKTAYRGENVELNGSGSDPDGHPLTYQWEQLGLDELGVVPVTPVTITDSDQAKASFVAPNQIGALSFKLTVTDSHGASHSDTVTVTVQNRSPIAYAGPNRVINATNAVTLEGSVSDWDPDDRDDVSPTWSKHRNNPADVTLVEVAGRPAHRTFIPDVAGVYAFTLTATDPYDVTVSDDVRVRVLPAADKVIPANVAATAASGRMDISWNRVSIATGYEVQLGVPEDGGEIGYASYTTTALSYRVENLAPFTRYHYRVRAENNSYVGPWSATESVVTPGETPPTPTADQWDVRQLNNKIQVKVTELPEVIPAISEVKAILSIGEELDLTTVEKDIGTSLNQWVDVLTSSDTDWQTGRWVAQVRFVNTSSSRYSLGKSVTVTSSNNNPPMAFAGYNQVVLVNSTVISSHAYISDSDEEDRERLTYEWEQIEGPEVRLISISPRTVLFTAPSTPGTLRFRLTAPTPADCRVRTKCGSRCTQTPRPRNGWIRT